MKSLLYILVLLVFCSLLPNRTINLIIGGSVGIIGALIFDANRQMNKLDNGVKWLKDDNEWNALGHLQKRDFIKIGCCQARIKHIKSAKNPFLRLYLLPYEWYHEQLSQDTVNSTMILSARTHIVKSMENRNQLIPFGCFSISVLVLFYEFFYKK